MKKRQGDSYRRKRILWRAPIKTVYFPNLAYDMAADGLIFVLDRSKPNGYRWFVADYEIPTKSVREKWDMSAHQMRRFIAWLLENKSELTEWE